MITLDRAKPGADNAKDWLLLKIVECCAEPMDDRIAQRLSTYQVAYDTLCRREEENGRKNQSRHRSSPGESITQSDAQEWVKGMKNTDGTTGPHWTMDQIKQVIAQRGIQCDPTDFYAVMNSLYSDFGELFKKYGVSKIDFYADLAQAWLDDADAVPNKAAAYFEYVVQH